MFICSIIKLSNLVVATYYSNILYSIINVNPADKLVVKAIGL